MIHIQKPVLRPTPETQPFWDGVKRNELVLPRCRACGELHHHPQSFCPRCLSWNLEWVKCSGRGKVYSYVVNHRPAHSIQAQTPGVIAVVELEEGPRVMSNLTGIEPDPAEVRVDMPVEIVFGDVNDHLTMLRFRPV